ncbi:hypothetical protein L596_004099 [Steinernema carpocapsae]|uniref:Uncharacterized protein n=1 Tax=Steinernema carpocapsae TaxID=34508 RepID=A0A4U8UUU8_STECR|nr:hypothetical protein L596_004099 [Steinernema carpocapsae]
MTTRQSSRASASTRSRRSASARRPDWQDSVVVEKKSLPALSEKMTDRTTSLKKIYGNIGNVSLPPIQRSLTSSHLSKPNGRSNGSRQDIVAGKFAASTSVAGSSRLPNKPHSEQALHELLNVVSFLKTNCKQLKRENKYLNSQVREMKEFHSSEQASTEEFLKKHKAFVEFRKTIVETSLRFFGFEGNVRAANAVLGRKGQRNKKFEDRWIASANKRAESHRRARNSRIVSTECVHCQLVAQALFRTIDFATIFRNYITNPTQHGKKGDDPLTFTKDIATQKMQQLTDLLTECESRLRVLSKEAQNIIKEEDSDEDARDSLSKLLGKLKDEHGNFRRQCDQIGKNVEKLNVAVNDEASTHSEAPRSSGKLRSESEEEDNMIADFIVLLQSHKKRLQILKTLDEAKEHDFPAQHFERRHSGSESTDKK